jgi:signal transduction histidine kinase
MLPHEQSAESPGPDDSEGNLPRSLTARSAGTPNPAAQLDVLRRLSHAFSSATSIGEVARSVGSWVLEATGSNRTSFRLLVPDAGGRLRTVASDEASPGGRKLSAQRRAVFREKRPVFISLNSPGGPTIGLFPLVSRGEAVGVLEITAPGTAIEDRRDTLLAVASQVAIALRSARERSLLERQHNPMIGFMELVRELVTAPTPKRAIAVAARLCFEHLDVPVAGWGMAEDRSRLDLTAVRGLDPQARRELKRAMRAMPPWDHQSLAQREHHVRTFAQAASASSGVTVGNAGDALLLIGGRSRARQPFVDNLVALLRDTLRNMAVTAQAERRNKELDLGIAWTAHELRRPMLGLRFLLASVLQESNSGTEEGIQLLKSQLDELVKGVDGMLRWAMGGPPVRSQWFDLARVAQSMLEAFPPEQGRERLRLERSPSVMVEGDPAQLRHAIENLVVNAVTYSPAETEVRIAIEEDEEGVTVTVQDQGPGIPAAYRDAVFDPFVRVGTGHQPRGGQGLGLFIAKQIIEGHGGSLWLEPGRKGATFRIRLPRGVSGSRRFAS